MREKPKMAENAVLVHPYHGYHFLVCSVEYASGDSVVLRIKA